MNFENILLYIVTFFGLYTAIFFLLTLFENRKTIKKRKQTKEFKVTIIVPAYNEEKTIAKTINSLLRLDYPKDKLEIIVVDDGSKDKTYKIAKRFVKKGIRLFTKKNEGKGKTLNFALKRAKGDIVGCLDADSFVEKTALKKLLCYFDSPDVMAVTPSLKIYKPKTILQRIQRAEFLFGIFLRKMFAFLGSIHVTPGPFSLYRKEFFDKYGGYDENNLTEDIEVALRIQIKGYKIENSVDASVYTVGPRGFKELLRQRLRWYLGFINNVIRYKQIFSRKHGNLGLFILPGSFISVLLIISVLFYSIYKIFSNAIKNYYTLKAVDYDIFGIFNFRIDLFYFSLSPLFILAVLSLFLGITSIYIAKILSKEKDSIITAYIPFLLFYWILFGFWWLVAGLFKIAKIRKIDW